MHSHSKKYLAFLSASLFLAISTAIAHSSIAATVAYTYDKAGRILAATYNDGQSIAYSYDLSGNRTSQTIVGFGPSGNYVEPATIIMLLNSSESSSVTVIDK